MLSNQEQVVRIKLLNLSEKERRELTHSLIDHHIAKSSGCYTLLRILQFSCDIETLNDKLDCMTN